MRRSSIVASLLVAVAVLTTAPTEAASPASGALNKAKRKLSWSGTMPTPNPTGDVRGVADVNNCIDPILYCDHFKLKVDMGQGGIVKVFLPVDATSDLDIYVMNPDGDRVDDTNAFVGESEVITWTHQKRFRNKPYDVQIIPYFALPGTTYKATAEIKKYVR